MLWRRIRDYRTLLEDDVRMRAYRRAIAHACADKVVCEIGVGLAPLTLMALEAGAKRVYGIEVHAETLQLATEIVHANGYDEGRFVPILGLSTTVDLPERSDVVISEILDDIGIGEGAPSFLTDAKRRFLAPDGVMLPSGLECYVALCAPASLRDEQAFWTDTLRVKHGFDYEPVSRAIRVNRPLPVTSADVCSCWAQWQHIDFGDVGRTFHRVSSVIVDVDRPATATGLAFTWRANLDAETVLGTRPDDAATHWQARFQPLQTPLTVDVGDLMHLDMTIIEGDRPTQFQLGVRPTRVVAADAPEFRSAYLR